MAVCLRETYSERKKNQFYLSFIYETVQPFFSEDFHKGLNSEVDFSLCAAEMESQWFSLSTGQRRICSTLLADIMFNTSFCPALSK